MAKAKRPVSVTQLDPLAHQILSSLLADFTARELDSDKLRTGYVGLSMPILTQQHCSDSAVSKVDFDLAFKQLEQGRFIRTGPMTTVPNTPGSGVVFVGLVSKREFAYLTEEGYRAARKSRQSFERF